MPSFWFECTGSIADGKWVGLDMIESNGVNGFVKALPGFRLPVEVGSHKAIFLCFV